jgi:hypothetical protein
LATTYYASITSDARTLSKDVDHAGTSSTAADVFEIRMGNGTYAPSRFEVLMAMEKFERWIVNGGLDGLGANLPVNTGG